MKTTVSLKYLVTYCRSFKNAFKAYTVLNDATNLKLHNHFFSYEKHLKCPWQKHLFK